QQERMATTISIPKGFWWVWFQPWWLAAWNSTTLARSPGNAFLLIVTLSDFLKGGRSVLAGKLILSEEKMQIQVELLANNPPEWDNPRLVEIPDEEIPQGAGGPIISGLLPLIFYYGQNEAQQR